MQIIIYFVIFSYFQNISCYKNNILFRNRWVPIVPYDSYIWSEGPQKITICDDDYVLWMNKNNTICLQENICPHRCAPLSEGYITKNGNLACSYHGWEFDETGSLTKIPQMNKCPSNKDLNIKNYEVKIVNNIVWGFITKIFNETQETHYGNETFNITESYYQSLDNNPNKKHITFMRELPYDYYILLENFFDPSHIPFAHHNLQSYRDAGSEVNSTIFKSKEFIEVNFTDNTKKNILNNTYDKRDGNMLFYPPYYYKLTNKDANSYIQGLHIYCIPISTSKCRVLLQYEFNEESNVYKLYNLLPIWIQHYFTNVFLDSDTLLLNNQEQNIRNQMNAQELKQKNKSYSLHSHPFYKMPSRSDLPIVSLRKFIKPYIPESTNNNDLKDQLPRKDILNRWEQHSKHCKYCKQAFNNTIFLKKYGTSLCFALYFVIDDPVIAIFAIMHYLILDILQNIFLFQDYRHNNLSE